MSITIHEAFKAMDAGKITKCNKNQLYYRKSTDESHVDFFDVSKSSKFEKIIYCNCAFTKEEIESQWEIVEQEEKIKPCIWCGIDMIDIYEPIMSPNLCYVFCFYDKCRARSPIATTRSDAIRIHNAMYDRLNPKPALLEVGYEMSKGLRGAGIIRDPRG